MSQCLGFLVKYIIYFFNFLVTLVGLAIVALGVVIVFIAKDVTEALPIIKWLYIGVIVVGSVLFIISFFGCCGAITETRCMLIMYAVFMVILTAGTIYVSVVIYDFFDNINSFISDLLQEAFDELREAFHAVEQVVKCCGTIGVESYANSSYIPPTCCADPIDPIGNLTLPTDVPSVLTCMNVVDTYPGCIETLTNYLIEYNTPIKTSIIIAAAVEAIAAFLAIFLCCTITSKVNKKKREEQRPRHYYHN